MSLLDHYNYDNYNKDGLDKVWDLWDLIFGMMKQIREQYINTRTTENAFL